MYKYLPWLKTPLPLYKIKSPNLQPHFPFRQRIGNKAYQYPRLRRACTFEIELKRQPDCFAYSDLYTRNHSH